MSIVAIIEFIKKILPWDRIIAWILGLITAALCIFMGANVGEVKKRFCAEDAVVLPSLAAPAVPAAK